MILFSCLADLINNTVGPFGSPLQKQNIFINMQIEMAKTKVRWEFPVKSSVKILYNYISTASGLSEWFADDVQMHDGIYFFKWNDTEQKAKLAHKRENQLVRFNWTEDPDHSFLEMEIMLDDITGDMALVVTDFTEKGDEEETKRLWESQIHTLHNIIGS